jgi:ribose transport system substrate-binding protein
MIRVATTAFRRLLVRKIAIVISVLALLLPLVGFAADAPKGAVDIGFSVPDTTNPFVGWLSTEVKKQADAEGIRLQIADAAQSPARQIEQIENFIAMGAKVIDIMPVDPNNVQDIIKRAQKQGVKILVAGTDTTYYDVMMNMNQYNCGEQISEMGIAWLQATYGSAKKKVLVIKSTTTVDMTNRSKGIIDKINAWGKANVVVATAEASTAAAATTIMENLWQKNSDAVAVLCYNADAALGVNEFIMGQAKVDKAKFGVFAGDWSPPIQEVLNNSATNASVFRGTMQIVGPKINGAQVELQIATYTLLKDLFQNGKASYGKWIQDSIQKAYAAKK